MRQVTNEVLLERLKGLTDLIDERFEENRKEHQSLIAQTTRTNGSVTTLNRWMSMSKGAIAVLTTFVVPLLLYLVYLHVQ